LPDEEHHAVVFVQNTKSALRLEKEAYDL
jgi:hypothetical protein